jgi:hypothetical protein
MTDDGLVYIAAVVAAECSQAIADPNGAVLVRCLPLEEDPKTRVSSDAIYNSIPKSTCHGNPYTKCRPSTLSWFLNVCSYRPGFN